MVGWLDPLRVPFFRGMSVVGLVALQSVFSTGWGQARYLTPRAFSPSQNTPIVRGLGTRFGRNLRAKVMR